MQVVFTCINKMLIVSSKFYNILLMQINVGGERVSEQLLINLRKETETNIVFVSDKIKIIREKSPKNLDIKDLSDLQRYAEILNHLSMVLDRVGKK